MILADIRADTVNMTDITDIDGIANKNHCPIPILIPRFKSWFDWLYSSYPCGCAAVCTGDCDSKMVKLL